MRTTMKIFLIFVVFIIATPLFVVAKETPALKVIFLFGLIAGIGAIWKYNPEEDASKKLDDSERNNSTKLDKK